MFVQLDEFFAREMTTQEKSADFGTFFFFRVLRGKNNLTRWSRTTGKNSQHITLKSNMSPFEMVPLYETLVKYHGQLSPPGFLRILRQPKKKTELNRGGEAKQTNVVAWDSGSKRSL